MNNRTKHNNEVQKNKLNANYLCFKRRKAEGNSLVFNRIVSSVPLNTHLGFWHNFYFCLFGICPRIMRKLNALISLVTLIIDGLTQKHTSKKPHHQIEAEEKSISLGYGVKIPAIQSVLFS